MALSPRATRSLGSMILAVFAAFLIGMLGGCNKGVDPETKLVFSKWDQPEMQNLAAKLTKDEREDAEYVQYKVAQNAQNSNDPAEWKDGLTLEATRYLAKEWRRNEEMEQQEESRQAALADKGDEQGRAEEAAKAENDRLEAELEAKAHQGQAGSTGQAIVAASQAAAEAKKREKKQSVWTHEIPGRKLTILDFKLVNPGPDSKYKHHTIVIKYKFENTSKDQQLMSVAEIWSMRGKDEVVSYINFPVGMRTAGGYTDEQTVTYDPRESTKAMEFWSTADQAEYFVVRVKGPK